MARKNKRYKSKYRRKYNTAGVMYTDNTVSAAGQGNQTANIVYQESNPEVLNQKLQNLENTKQSLIAESENVATEIENQQAQDKQELLLQEQQNKQKTAAQTETTKKIAGKVDDLLNKETTAVDASGNPITDQLGNTVIAPKITDFSSDLIKTGKDLYGAGTTPGITAAAPKGVASIVNPATGEGMSLLPGQPIPEGFMVEGVSGGSGVSTALSKLGSGVKAFGAKHAGSAMGKAGSWMTKGVGAGKIASMVNPASIASVVGAGVKYFSDDDDPTTFNFGEATGSVLSGAGTGATIGSMILPGIGTAAGAIIGGAYAGIKGLVSRNKARREEARNKRRIENKVALHNQELSNRFLSAQADARSAEIKSKTTSGYDLGRNTTAKYGGYYNKGGMKMGMPRYGYAA